jgi:hypothetical protein
MPNLVGAGGKCNLLWHGFYPAWMGRCRVKTRARAAPAGLIQLMCDANSLIPRALLVYATFSPQLS